jgi:uncharacterized membrane protein
MDNMNELQWHPMMVHFPLALALTGYLCLLFSRLLQRAQMSSSLAACGHWNLILGTLAAFLTLGTGLDAAWHLHLYGDMQYSVSRHMIWAVCTSQLLALLALWRALANDAKTLPSGLFLALLFIACGGLVMTGYYGGENVYHYAIGVRR